MPSKKRKYNARFPAGRIKKIMQTDEEVGKVAQAVPIIILELFVESLLNKAMQVTVSRNAKTLSPSHVKQCILAETRFDFLKDLVKNIPDVSAVDDKETVSADSSPNSSRFPELSAAPRRIAREDSNSSSSSGTLHRDTRPPSSDESPTKSKCETVTKEAAIDLTLQQDKPIRTANFYQETLLTDDVPQHSVITKNPIYSNPSPSTSSFLVEPKDLLIPKTEHKPVFFKEVGPPNNMFSVPLRSRPALIPLRTPTTPVLTTFRTPPRSPITPTGVAMPSTPITPIINIDFSKNISNPEIKVLDSSVANLVGITNESNKLQRQNSETKRRKVEKVIAPQPQPVNLDIFNSGNLQIDEDYDT